MWIASTHGFFSIVRKTAEEFHVRGRVLKDLENLRKAARLENPIQKWDGADYRFRMIVSELEMNKVFVALLRSIDYPNFKSEIGRRPDQREKLPEYHEIWGLMARVQAREEAWGSATHS